MWELVISGQLVGVFSSKELAMEYVRQKYASASFQMHRLGTWIKTDKHVNK